jgi:hypothetical protein
MANFDYKLGNIQGTSRTEYSVNAKNAFFTQIRSFSTLPKRALQVKCFLG